MPAMMVRTAARVVLLGAVAFAARPAGAEEAAARPDPRAAFTETDTSKDGAIDRGEFHVRLVEVFYFADTDKDGALTPEEQKRLAFPEDFAAQDKDGNGRLALREFLRVRFADFDATDSDHDGVLSEGEVVAAYEGRKAR